mmetsp:Transcript_71541/g.232527  ORF Transcript_71541/g.232527 Transcript_71541/m.232527 type:complete len:226 (-) Transcript_71541:1026-1703(-)
MPRVSGAEHRMRAEGAETSRSGSSSAMISHSSSVLCSEGACTSFSSCASRSRSGGASCGSSLSSSASLAARKAASAASRTLASECWSKLSSTAFTSSSPMLPSATLAASTCIDASSFFEGSSSSSGTLAFASAVASSGSPAPPQLPLLLSLSLGEEEQASMAWIAGPQATTHPPRATSWKRRPAVSGSASDFAQQAWQRSKSSRSKHLNRLPTIGNIKQPSQPTP